jgi:hypothetical protein
VTETLPKLLHCTFESRANSFSGYTKESRGFLLVQTIQVDKLHDSAVFRFEPRYRSPELIPFLLVFEVVTWAGCIFEHLAEGLEAFVRSDCLSANKVHSTTLRDSSDERLLGTGPIHSHPE